jgi:hypothetical protein
MRATQTFVIDLSRLERLGSDGNLVIRLMRAADDIALANWGLKHFSQDQPPIARHVQRGARRYFVRLQCGHLTEALDLIREIQNCPMLVQLLDRSDEDIKSAFADLSACLSGGAKHRDFKNWIAPIKNRTIFHYDKSLISRALKSRAARVASPKSTITRGTEIGLWRSELADDIEDTVVCRLLWRIPVGDDTQDEADRIADFASSLCRDFMDLAGDLSFRYLRENASSG